MAALLQLPVAANPDGWGPVSMPEAFKDLPYVPFGKGDKLGKVADWGAYTRQGRYRCECSVSKFAAQPASVHGVHPPRAASRHREENTDFQYTVDRKEEKTFKQVDYGSGRSTRSKAGGRGRGRGRFTRRGGGRGRGRGGRFGSRSVGDMGRGGSGAYEDLATRKQRKLLATNHNKRISRLNRARKASRRTGMQRHVHREETVKVDAAWNMLAQFELEGLTKLETPTPSVTDLKWAGSLRQWDSKLDRLRSRSKVPLVPPHTSAFYYTTAREDPILQQCAEEGTGNVYASDAVLAHLMTCARSVYPWDIVISYLPGGDIFLDVRDGLDFQMHTVGETSHSPPPEGLEAYELNGASALAEEAMAVQESFSQQSLLPEGGAKAVLPDGKAAEKVLEEDPFWDEDEADEGQEGPAAVAYRYRSFDLGDDINLVARTSVHAWTRLGGKPALVNAFALTEGDPKKLGQEPYSKMMDKRGTLLATEIQNNSFKMAKFVATATLSGADSIRLGFVARANVKSSDEHVILGAQHYKPASLGHQMSLTTTNMWGVVKWLIMLVRQHAANLRAAQDDDEEEDMLKFVLVRDGNKSLITLYAVPAEMFEDDDDDDDDDDEEEDEASAAAGAGGSA